MVFAVAAITATAMWAHRLGESPSGVRQLHQPVRPESARSRAAGLSEARPSAFEPARADVRADPLGTLYGARTLTDLKNSLYALTGDRVYDGLELEHDADLFCAYGGLADGRARSFVEVTRSFSGGSPDAMRSAQWLDTLRSTFCEGRIGSPPPGFDPVLLLDLPHMAGLDELAELETAARQVDVDELIADRAERVEIVQARAQSDEIRAHLLDFMAATGSPAAFRRAAESLTSVGSDWYPGETRAKAALQNTPPYWRMVGPELAFCRMAPAACAAGSMTTINRCMPINCRPGESLLDYYRRTESPQTMAIANAYADALMALRAGRR